MELGREPVGGREELPPPNLHLGFSSDCEVESPKLSLSASLSHLQSRHLCFEASQAKASRLDFAWLDLGFFFLQTLPSS